ncbi:MAG: formate--tetrahydrofolate ligase, partial [Oscillospiraceae bacterium]
MYSDIEIAQGAKMLPITEIAAKLGISEDMLEPYGRTKAKLNVSELNNSPNKAKLILVNSINPTPAG